MRVVYITSPVSITGKGGGQCTPKHMVSIIIFACLENKMGWCTDICNIPCAGSEGHGEEKLARNRQQ